jgi:hypothetical protein
MRKLLVMTLVLSLGGAGCGGCVDDDTKPKGQPPAPRVGDQMRRQRAVGTIIGDFDAGLAPTTGDP